MIAHEFVLLINPFFRTILVIFEKFLSILRSNNAQDCWSGFLIPL